VSSERALENGNVMLVTKMVCAGCGAAIGDLETGYVTLPAPSSGRPPLECYHDGCGRRDDRRESLARFRSYLGSRHRGAALHATPSSSMPALAVRRAPIHRLAWKQQRTPRGSQIYVVRNETQIVYVGKTMHTVGARLRAHLAAGDAVGQAMAEEVERVWEEVRGLALRQGHFPEASLPDRSDPVYVRPLQRWVDRVPEQLWVEYRRVSGKPFDLDVVEQALIQRHQPLHNRQHRGSMARWQRWHDEEGELLVYRVRLLPAADRVLVQDGWPPGREGTSCMG
jgi:hypothetical protein